MKHTYFVDYVDDFNDIYNGFLKKYDKAIEALDSARKRKVEADADYTSQWHIQKKQIAASELRDAERAFQREANMIQDEAARAFSALRKELQRDISEFAVADPKRVDTNALALLNSGILSTSDLVKMASDNWNNPTMLRLVSSHCGNRQFEDSRDGDRARNAKLKNSIDAYCTGKTQFEVFDSAMLWASKCFQSREGVAKAMQVHFGEAIEKLREQMATADSFNVEV